MDSLVMLWWWRRRKKQSKKPRKRLWVHPIYLSRQQEGEYHTLFKEIRQSEKKFFKYARMSIASFDELLSLVGPSIQHYTTNYRETISPEERLILTLRFLATGESFRSVGFSFRIAPPTAGRIVLETCEIIWRILQHQCFPKFSHTMWKDKAKQFGELWNFEFCIGAIDSKHVKIQGPATIDKNSSLLLQTIIDADLMFTFVEVGDYGNNRSGSVFKKTKFGKAYLRQKLNLPSPVPHGTMGKEIPYCFVSDEAYPLNDNLMRPYNARHLNDTKSVFNQRLLHARKTVKYAFDILTAKWGIFQCPLRINVESAEKVVLAACALHNYVRSRDGGLKDKAIILSRPGPRVSGLQNLEKLVHPGRRCDKTVELRDTLALYMNEGNRTSTVFDSDDIDT